MYLGGGGTQHKTNSTTEGGKESDEVTGREREGKEREREREYGEGEPRDGREGEFLAKHTEH